MGKRRLDRPCRCRSGKKFKHCHYRGKKKFTSTTKGVRLPFNAKDIANLKRLVCPIVAVYRRTEIVHLGSGFIIGTFNQQVRNRAIFATAAHVLEDAMKRDRPYHINHPTTPSEFLPQESMERSFKDIELFAVILRENGKAYAAPLVLSWHDRNRDIALCGIEVSEDAATCGFALTSKLQINSRGPHTGALVIAAGYHKLQQRLDQLEPAQFQEGEFELEVDIDMYGGTVKEVIHDRGDGHHRYPHFTSSAPFHFGMSGGPVLQIAGAEHAVVACGIISSDIEDLYQPAGNLPKASIIWTSTYISTNFTVNPGLEDEKINTNFLDLIRFGVVSDVMSASDHIDITVDQLDIPVISWNHKNDLESFVNDCVRRHTKGLEARFIGVLLNIESIEDMKLVTPLQTFEGAISYYVDLDWLNHIKTDWQYVVLIPDYSGVNRQVAKSHAKKLARGLIAPAFFDNVLNGTGAYDHAGAMFDNAGQRLELKIS